MACHVHTHNISGDRYNHLPVCPVKTSGTCHTCLQQQLMEIARGTFASPSRNNEENKKEKKQNAKSRWRLKRLHSVRASHFKTKRKSLY